METRQSPALKAIALHKKFGDFVAVKDFNLTLTSGQVVGILGPNGAGKTTIIRMLLGLIKPTSGVVEIGGKNLKENFLSAISHIGSLVEVPAFYNYLSGRKNLELLYQLSNSCPDMKVEIDWALDRLNLSHRANDQVKKYSQGMRQRLGIAAAIFHKPQILILDEPTNGLDPEGMIEIRQLIKSLASDEGMSILLSSHLLSEIEQVCDAIVILNNGITIAQGKVSDLIQPEDENLEMLFLRLMKQIRYE